MLLSRRPTESVSAERAITVVAGKGGVGKSTVAAAIATGLADAGHQTLLLSADTAHSLGDVFGTDIGDKAREVSARMWVRQPDPDKAVRRRVEQVARDAREVVSAERLPAVRRHLDHAAASPGMVESALADQLVEAMEQVPSTWGRLVVDSAPTGQLLRMLELPTLLAPWIHGLARHRERAVRTDRFATALDGAAPDTETDPLLEALDGRRQRLETAAGRLRDDCIVRVVLVPRRVVLSETERAVAHLTRAGLHIGPVVINQVPTDRRDAALDEARNSFKATGAVEVPLLTDEPVGHDALRDVAARAG